MRVRAGQGDILPDKRATFVIGADRPVLVITSEINVAKHADRALAVFRFRALIPVLTSGLGRGGG